jgi:hypothetical protein
MLIAILLSFISARKFRGSRTALLMIVVIVLISFFSAFNMIRVNTYNSTYYFTPNLPIPLSFPLYVLTDTNYVFISPPYSPPLHGYYQLYFLTVEIGSFLFPLRSDLFLLLYSFFILVNTIGATFGYWIGKSALLERLIKTNYLLNDQSKQPVK